VYFYYEGTKKKCEFRYDTMPDLEKNTNFMFMSKITENSKIRLTNGGPKNPNKISGIIKPNKYFSIGGSMLLKQWRPRLEYTFKSTVGKNLKFGYARKFRKHLRQDFSISMKKAYISNLISATKVRAIYEKNQYKFDTESGINFFQNHFLLVNANLARKILNLSTTYCLLFFYNYAAIQLYFFSVLS